MYEEMIAMAKARLDSLTEKVDCLPSPQVTVLLTGNDRIYLAVNDTDGRICGALQSNCDTKIAGMVTVWKDGGVDLPSIRFRKALLEMDGHNRDTQMLLQGGNGYILKKIAETVY